MPSTQNEKRNAYLTRESILMLLSNNEVGSVTTAETAPHLTAGEEYLDLEHLDQGVQRASVAFASMGRVLPRKSVHEDTWSKILTQLASSRSTTGSAGR